MREHTRENTRYFRTEAGALTLDWGSDGNDYKELDFSYVAKAKSGNLQKVYGRIRRNEDGETFDTYDIKAGNCRLKTSKNSTIDTAIRAHVREVAGDCPSFIMTKGKMPVVPNSIRDEISEVMLNTISKWNFVWRGDMKFLGETEKEKIRKDFVVKYWDCGKFYCDVVGTKKSVTPVGLLNVEIGEYSNLYRMWRDYCASL